MAAGHLHVANGGVARNRSNEVTCEALDELLWEEVAIPEFRDGQSEGGFWSAAYESYPEAPDDDMWHPGRKPQDHENSFSTTDSPQKKTRGRVWTNDDDRRLMSLCESHGRGGRKTWEKIEEDLGVGCSLPQLRRRFEQLRWSIEKSAAQAAKVEWTEEEDKQLVQLQWRHGYAWKQIQADMPHARTTNQLRKRFYFLKGKSIWELPTPPAIEECRVGEEVLRAFTNEIESELNDLRLMKQKGTFSRYNGDDLHWFYLPL